MSFSAKYDEARTRLNDVYILALGNLVISGVCFGGETLGVFGSTGMLVGFGVLALANGTFFLNARQQLSDASKSDAENRTGAGKTLAASLQDNQTSSRGNSNRELPEIQKTMINILRFRHIEPRTIEE